jgi:predicted PurR-regulated permease PerM
MLKNCLDVYSLKLVNLKNVTIVNMKDSINIDTKTFIRFWLVVIGFGLVGFAIYSAWPALAIIGLSLFLAISLNPSVSYIAKHLNSKSRVIGTAIAYATVLSVIGIVVLLVIPPVLEQTSKFINTLPSLLDSATSQYSGFKDLVSNYNLQPQVDEVINSIKTSATHFASGIGSNLIAGIGSILYFITTMIIVLVLTFLMLVEGPGWIKQIWGLYGNKATMSKHRDVVQKMYSVVTSYVAGQLTISTIAGLFAGTVVFVLSLTMGTPVSLVIPTAAIVFVMSLIPFFGAFIGSSLMGLALAINSLTAGLIFIVICIIYQQVEANFIGPKIQSKKLNLSPLVILISVTLGIVLFGIAGGIISIPIAGCVKILLDNYLSKSQLHNQTEIKPVV